MPSRTTIAVGSCETVAAVTVGAQTPHAFVDLVFQGERDAHGAYSEVRVQIERVDDLDRLERAVVAARETFPARTIAPVAS